MNTTTNTRKQKRFIFQFEGEDARDQARRFALRHVDEMQQTLHYYGCGPLWFVSNIENNPHILFRLCRYGGTLFPTEQETQ